MRIALAWLLVLAFSLACVPAARAATQVSIGRRYGDTVSDTWLSEYRKTTRYNTSGVMSVGLPRAAQQQRIIIRFPLAKVAGSTVTSATLHLTQSYGASGYVLRAYRLARPDTDWTQATWNVYRTGMNWSVAGAGGAGTDYWATPYAESTSYNNFNLTGLAQAAVAAGSSTLDLLIVDPAPVAGRKTDFYSSDEYSSAELWPSLDLLTEPLDPVPPTIAIISPANGSDVSGVVPIAALVADAETGIARVEYRVDGVLTYTADTAPYSCLWDTTGVAPGIHTVLATAFDAAGNSTAASLTLRVVDTLAPAVGVTQPTDQGVVRGTVPIRATASDNVGVDRVDFYVDSTLVGSDSTAPYETSWTSTAYPDGQHTVRAVAFDAAGNSADSSVAVVVHNLAPTLTEVTTGTGVTTATVSWMTDEPATSRVEYGLDATYGTSSPIDTTRVTSHSVALTGLSPSTTYHFRVESTDAVGNSTRVE